MGNGNKLRPLALLFGIITFFIFAVSFSVFYTTENFSSVCGCRLPLWVILVSISSLGLFVGLITYYIVSNHFLKEKRKNEKNLLNILNILEEGDREALKRIIENKGEITQSSLSKALNFDKVKTSRIISKLETRGVLKKEKSGMTNKLVLNEELRDLFLKE